MNIPPYLIANEDSLKNVNDQVIAPWSNSYSKFRKEFKVVQEIYDAFPDRRIQRQGVLEMFRKDLYSGFIASMMWGGINSTRPKTEGGIDTNFWKLLSHPQDKVLEIILYARDEIRAGNLTELFASFSQGGQHKLPGVGSSYFTKLFFFLGELEPTIVRKPLIWDKWTQNAHCALLIDTKSENVKYGGINDTYKNTLLTPNGNKRANLYTTFVNDFNCWASNFGVAPAKLEEFVFGQPLNHNLHPDNPRRVLWNVILNYFEEGQHIKKKLKLPPVDRQQKVNKLKNAVRLEECPELEPHNKYYALQKYIKSRKQEKVFEIKISFIEKELLIRMNKTCFNAPSAFWGNGGWETNRQKRAWVSQGFEVAEYSNIDGKKREGQIRFRRVN